MVHIMLLSPITLFIFRFSPDRGNDRTKRAERRRLPVSFRKSTAWRIFYVQDCRFLNCPESQLTLSGQRRHLVTRANAHGVRARGNDGRFIRFTRFAVQRRKRRCARETGAIDDAESLALTPMADGHTCGISNARASRTPRFTS